MEIFNMDEFGDMGGVNTFQQKETIDVNNIKDDSIKTDVADVDSDAYYAVGTEKFPIFDVNQSEFFNNMKVDRQRMRWNSGSKAQEYSQKTRYRNPFFIRYKDEKGNAYVRRVK